MATHLDNARADLLAFTSYPKDVWAQIWSNNPTEQLNKEIRPIALLECPWFLGPGGLSVVH